MEESLQESLIYGALEANGLATTWLFPFEMHPVETRREYAWCGLFRDVSDKRTSGTVALTAKGKEESAKWTKVPQRQWMLGTREVTWAVPAARQQVKTITGVSQAPDAPVSLVEFDGEWVRLEFAEKFKLDYNFPSGEWKGRATFRRFDDGWRVEKVDH